MNKINHNHIDSLSLLSYSLYLLSYSLYLLSYSLYLLSNNKRTGQSSVERLRSFPSSPLWVSNKLPSSGKQEIPELLIWCGGSGKAA
nr:hypothetical protein Q903MT_gene5314 [Picea sitchensis]